MMVYRLHREVEAHQLDDRPKAPHRRAGADPGEAIFGDRRIDHPLGARIPSAAPGSPCRRPDIRRLPHPSRTRARRARISSAIASRSASRTVVRDQRRAFGHLGLVTGRSDVGNEIARRGLEYVRCRRAFGPAARPGFSTAVRRLCVRSGWRRGAAASSGLGRGRGGRYRSPPRLPPARSRDRLPRPSLRRCPSGTRIFAILPSSTASNSIVALSVSISARMSPDFTVVAFLDQPFGERALFHRRGQRGHQELRRHQ